MKLQELRDTVAKMRTKAMADIREVLHRKNASIHETHALAKQAADDCEADIKEFLNRERFNVQAEPIVQIEARFYFTVEGAPEQGDYVEVQFNNVAAKVDEQTGALVTIYQEKPDTNPDDWTAIVQSRTQAQDVQAISVFRSAMRGLELLHISQRVI